MPTPTEQAETPVSETSDLTADQQIQDLLVDEFEEEAEDTTPTETEKDETLPQEEAETEDEQSEDKADQEEAEEAATWAEALGLDDSQIVLDDDGNFKSVITKVEGKTQQVDLKELVKGYQIDSYNTLKSEALTAERQRFEQQANQQAAELQQRIGQANALVSNMEQQIVGEFNSIDWEQLRQADPAEYAAQRQDYAVKYNNVQQMTQNIQLEQQHLQQEQANKVQQANNARLQSEAQLVLKEHPEWENPEVRDKELGSMRGLLQDKYGYTAEEISRVDDHRIIKIAGDLQAYHAIKKEGAPKLEKKVPKYSKPISNRKSGRNTKAKKLDTLYKKAAGSSNRKLKDDAIEQLLLNS